MTDDDKNEKDFVNNIIAVMDQQGAILKDIARPLFAFYSGLVNQGFTKEQAMEIVLKYVTKLFTR